MGNRLSVIIPVYNAEQYLKNTLDSVCKQTVFDDIEVIIIDDGSTDGSLDICRSYEKKHSNIKVYTQENRGVSSARNCAIGKATGEYITFLDSDDYVCKDLYEKELNLICTSGADIGIVDFYKKHEDGKEVKYRHDFRKEWKITDQVLEDFFSGVVGNQVVDKIFASKIIKGIEFPKNYKIGEDMWFMFLALRNAQRVVMDTSIAGYYYIVRDSSAMTGTFSDKYFDPVKLSKRMCEEVSGNEKMEKYAKAHLIHETCKALEYVYRHNAESKCKAKVNELKQELRHYSVKDGYSYLIRKQFYGFILMRTSPKLYLVAHKIMKIG